MGNDQEAVLRALRGSQWVRSNNGSLYKCGLTDSWYKNPQPRHTINNQWVFVNDKASVAEYMAGYESNPNLTTAEAFRLSLLNGTANSYVGL